MPKKKNPKQPTTVRSEKIKEQMKALKEQLNIQDKDIAENFGFANAQSYRSSRARAKFDNGLVWFYNLIKGND